MGTIVMRLLLTFGASLAAAAVLAVVMWLVFESRLAVVVACGWFGALFGELKDLAGAHRHDHFRGQFRKRLNHYYNSMNDDHFWFRSLEWVMITTAAFLLSQAFEG